MEMQTPKCLKVWWDDQESGRAGEDSGTAQESALGTPGPSTQVSAGDLPKCVYLVINNNNSEFYCT